MKVELVPPTPAEPEVVITLSREEARDLARFLVELDPQRSIRFDLMAALRPYDH
jgi:hypothetical protein